MKINWERERQMNKPILVTQATIPEFEEYIEEIKDIWQSHWLSNMGVKHNLLEEQLKEYLDIEHLVLCTNGHTALEMALQAFGLAGEVITTPFTFASTTHAIVRCNLTPVFCDINPETFTIDADKIEDLITEKTSAIVPVHVYGNICEVEKINTIAQKYNLKVIYDAAHAMGVKYKDRGIGSYGDASIFSFHATKVFNTIEGGAVCCRDKEIYNKICSLKNFGMDTSGRVIDVGGNAKMNEFQAAMGICNLKHIQENIYKRGLVIRRYRHALANIDGIELPVEQNNIKRNFAYMPIRVIQGKYGMCRDELCSVLEKANIFPRKYFYPLTSQFECYQQRFPVQYTPSALKIAEEVITLPLYPDLPLETVDFICDIIKRK